MNGSGFVGGPAGRRSCRVPVFATLPQLAGLLVVCVALAMPGQAESAPPSRLTVLPAPAAEPSELRLVIADEDGGFSVYLHDGRVVMFDANDALVGQYASPLLESGRIPVQFGGLSVDGGHVVFRGEAGQRVLDRRQESGTMPECSIDSLAGGRSLKVFHLERIAGLEIFHQQVDGQGGFWAIDRNGRLFRYGSDCSKKMIASIDGVAVGLSADPSRAAAFVHTQDGRVIHADRSGIRWQRTLPDFDTTMDAITVPIGSIGAGLHVTPYGSYTYGIRLAAHDVAGNLAWIWDDASGDGIGYMQVHSAGVLVVSSNAVRLIDATGRERWHETIQNSLISSVSAERTSRHAWLYFHSFDHYDRHEIMAFDLDRGEIGRWEVETVVRPAAGRADGSVLAMRGDRLYFSEPGQALFHGRLDGKFVPLNLPRIPADSRVVATLVDEQGSLAVGIERSSWTISGLDAALKLRWQHSRDIEITHTQPDIQLAANEQVACILIEHWTQSRQGTGLEVHCVDRQSGQPLFAPVDWDGFSGHLNPRIATHVEIIHAGPLDSQMIRRRLVGLDGRVLDKDGTLPTPLYASRDSLRNILFAESGHTALVTDNRGSSVYIFPPASAVEQKFVQIDPPLGLHDRSGADARRYPSVAIGHGQVAMLGSAQFSSQPWPIVTHWVRVHSVDTGRLLWEKEIFSPGRGFVAALLQSPEGWLLAQVSADKVHLNHFRAANGKDILERILPINEPLLEWVSGSKPLANFSVQGSTVAIVSPLPAGTRIHWIDLLRGEISATATSPLLRWDPIALPAPRADGTLVVAGLAPGGSYPQSALMQVSPKSRQPVSGTAVAALNGAWFDPTTTGQGWFIDVIKDARIISGAWFTYDQTGPGDASGLRWYTMQGDYPSADGVAELALYRNVGGAFEAPPVTRSKQVGRVRLWQTASGNAQMEVIFENEGISFQAGQDLTRIMSVSTANSVRQWFDPEISGQGLLLAQPLEAAGPLVGGWFTYDPSGKSDDPTAQHWFTIQGPATDDSTIREGVIYRTVGGMLATSATRNTHPVGTVLLARISCNRILMDYQFDVSEVAGPFAGTHGRRELRPIAGCRPS